MLNQKIIDGLRKVGAKQLQESYPDVTPDNITTDPIYKEFFAASLEETLEQAPQFGKEINFLLQEIKKSLSISDIVI
jgi:hypothetical protein